VQILLLRGINIGPNNRISMPDLRDWLGEAGHGPARTYLQSGNVVVRSDADPDELARRTEQLISERAGLSVPVVVRTRDELAGVIARDPLRGEERVEKLYQVTFFSQSPPEDVSARIAALAADGERFEALGREWYAYHPSGVARSKLATGISARNLGFTATARNWTTVTSLLALSDELADER
jgi:uncharacterized protein (DUF1697 family)